MQEEVENGDGLARCGSSHVSLPAMRSNYYDRLEQHLTENAAWLLEMEASADNAIEFIKSSSEYLDLCIKAELERCVFEGFLKLSLCPLAENLIIASSQPSTQHLGQYVSQPGALVALLPGHWF